MQYDAGITGGGLCSMLRKRSCMIRECRWLDQQQRKPQWVSFMPETQKKRTGCDKIAQTRGKTAIRYRFRHQYIGAARYCQPAFSHRLVLEAPQ